MADLYQFWFTHLNLWVTFQSHIRFARKVQKYGMLFKVLLYVKNNELENILQLR